MTRIVCLSDSHERNLRTQVPLLQEGGDILIHAGDFTSMGRMEKLARFGRMLDALPFTHKIVIAGNHDRCFQREHEAAAEAIREHAIYLEDEAVELLGLRIYGMPWLPPLPPTIREEFRSFNAYPDTRAKLDLIPDGTDVLITHGPPAGILTPNQIGDPALTSQVMCRIKPRLHVFGHDHMGHGMERRGETTFVNASLCDAAYRLAFEPVTVDV